ncbi:MAG: hypothetical protein ACLFVR_10040 [Thiohalospira sp.]
MKKIVLTMITVCLATVTLLAQSSLGFNYQAVIRDASGDLLANQTVGLKISILEGSTTGNVVYSETFTPKTSEFGLVNLIIGNGDPVSGNFADINWSTADYYLKLELDATGGTDYEVMGTTQLLSVPYANYAFSAANKSWVDKDSSVTTSKRVGIGTSTPSSMLEVVSDGKGKEDVPLFEVKNSNGETVFAVYENSVKVYVDEEDEGSKSVGGFAVSGRTSTKETNDILVVTPEKTQVYVDETSGKSVGGFAVSGRTSTKSINDILHITNDQTTIYVDENDEKSLGGFAVSGRTSTKGDADIFRVTTDLTQVFVGESTSKSLGGFAVSGRTSNKADETYDVLMVRPERTDVYIKPDGSKLFPDGFTISGLDNNLESTELFSVSEAGTLINTYMAAAPKLTTTDTSDVTQVSAIAGGIITEDGGAEIIERGIVYTSSGTPSLNIDFGSLDPSVGGIVNDVEGGTGDYTVTIPATGNLQPGTTYYYRAYAINGDTLTGYGETKQFTTDDPSMLNFMVQDIDESQIDNATITLYPFGDIYNPIQNPAGDYVFYVADGTHSYSVEASGYESIEMEELSVFGETYWDVYLTPEVPIYTIIFEVTRNDGSIAEGFDVSLYSSGDYNEIQTTDASGVATFLEVPEGEFYDVYIYKDGDPEYHSDIYSINEQSPYYDNVSGDIIIPVELSLSK